MGCQLAVAPPAKLVIQHLKLTILQGDVLVADQVEKAVLGQDAVISALGPTRPFVPGMQETAVKNITRAMQKRDIRRLISTGGTVPQDQPGLVDNLIKSLIRRDVSHDFIRNRAI